MKYIRFSHEDGHEVIAFPEYMEHKFTSLLFNELFSDHLEFEMVVADAGFMRRGQQFVAYGSSETIGVGSQPQAGREMSQYLKEGFGFIQTHQGLILVSRALVDRVINTPPVCKVVEFPLLCGYIKIVGETEFTPVPTKVELEIKHNPQNRELERQAQRSLGQLLSYT